MATKQPSTTPQLRSDASSADRERDHGTFSATVSAITNAFGDPTRRGIYLFARSSDHGVTAAQVATQFGLHSNVARHHLDRLAAGGYLEVAVERALGSGAGRPSKHYRAASEALPDVPVRSDDLVLTLLGKALALLPSDQAEAMAEQVGREYGATMALGLTGNDLAVGQRSLRSALHAVADALTAHGFAAHAETRGNALTLVAEHCPFGEAARQYPHVLCAVDTGMVKGMLEGLYGETQPTIEQSRPHGDDTCVTRV